MPIHFNDRKFVSELSGIESVLIVPCYMCPAVTVSVREDKPFIQFFRHFMRSAPFEHYLNTLESRLRENGLKTKVFKSNMYHQWFMCMWTSRRRKKLHKTAKDYDAIIVLGCQSATETVVKETESTDCRVIEAMEVSGIMNAELTFQLPGNVSFANCRIVPMSKPDKADSMKA